MRTQIQPIQKEDIGEVAQLHYRVVRQENAKVYPKAIIKEWLKDVSAKNIREQLKSSAWLVARTDNKIVGFGQYSLEKREIFQININPEVIGQGIGRQIHQEIENVFRDRQVREINLYATLNSVGFYGKMGYEKIKTILYPLGKGSLEMVKMRKLLN